MKKKAVHDKAVGQTVRCKNKGTSKRYAFADYSDDIQIGGKVKQVYTHKFYDDMNSKTKGYDKLQELAKSLRKVQLVKTHEDKGRIRCNMTHIFVEGRTKVIEGKVVLDCIVIDRVVSLSQAKKQYKGIQSMYFSRKRDGQIGDMFSAAANVN